MYVCVYVLYARSRTIVRSSVGSDHLAFAERERQRQSAKFINLMAMLEWKKGQGRKGSWMTTGAKIRASTVLATHRLMRHRLLPFLLVKVGQPQHLNPDTWALSSLICTGVSYNTQPTLHLITTPYPVPMPLHSVLAWVHAEYSSGHVLDVHTWTAYPGAQPSTYRLHAPPARNLLCERTPRKALLRFEASRSLNCSSGLLQTFEPTREVSCRHMPSNVLFDAIKFGE